MSGKSRKARNHLEVGSSGSGGYGGRGSGGLSGDTNFEVGSGGQMTSSTSRTRRTKSSNKRSTGDSGAIPPSGLMDETGRSPRRTTTGKRSGKKGTFRSTVGYGNRSTVNRKSEGYKSALNDSMNGGMSSTSGSQMGTGRMGTRKGVESGPSHSRKKEICLDIITEGYVDSFIDFFYLTHEPVNKDTSVNPDEMRRAKIYSKEYIDPDDEKEGFEDQETVEKLNFLEEKLKQTETAKRDADADKVFSGYKDLAEYFQMEGDLQTSIGFHQRTLEIAQETYDVDKEIQANGNLGKTYEKLDHVLTAIHFLEKCVELGRKEKASKTTMLFASSLDEANRRLDADNDSDYGDEVVEFDEDGNPIPRGETAESRLIKAYLKYADQCENEKRFAEAVEFHEKSLEVAKFTEDLDSEGFANYRLGLAHGQLDDLPKAIQFYKRYYAVCNETEDSVGKCKACASLAFCYRNQEDLATAKRYLETYLTLAKRIKRMDCEAEACCLLGIIHNMESKFAQSAGFFEQSYLMMRQLVEFEKQAMDEGTEFESIFKDKYKRPGAQVFGRSAIEALDNTRVYLGIAQGNLKTYTYLQVAIKDPERMYAWKTVREPLDEWDEESNSQDEYGQEGQEEATETETETETEQEVEVEEEYEEDGKGEEEEEEEFEYEQTGANPQDFVVSRDDLVEAGVLQ